MRWWEWEMCGNCLRGQDPQEHMAESLQSPATLRMGIRGFLASTPKASV